MSLILYSLPFFFGLIFLEAFLLRKKKGAYVLEDSMANLSLGMLDVLLGLFTGSALTAGYVWSWHVFGLFKTELKNPTAINWIILLLAVDFIYYWFHRLSHRIHFMWMGHVVHHSSNHYNFSVALRQGPFQHLFSYFFYLPLSFLGFHPLMILTASSINTVYQFWIHTEGIGRLGPLEKILNTPSHHRVHHGIQSVYWDKNYAGMFIFWDKLFGSFQEETIPVRYGVADHLNYYQPFRAVLVPFLDLAQRFIRASGVKEKFFCLFADPGKSRHLKVPEQYAPMKVQRSWPASFRWPIFSLCIFLCILLMVYSERLGLAPTLGVTALVLVLIYLLGRKNSLHMTEGSP